MQEKTIQCVETGWCIQRVNKRTQELILVHALTCPASYWVFSLNLARSTKWLQIASTCRSMKLTVKSHDPLLSPSISYAQRRCELGLHRRCGASLTTTGIAGAIGARRQTNTYSCLHMHEDKKTGTSTKSAHLTLRLVSWEVTQESHDHLWAAARLLLDRQAEFLDQ